MLKEGTISSPRASLEQEKIQGHAAIDGYSCTLERRVPRLHARL